MITAEQVLRYVSAAGMRGTNDPEIAAHWQARGLRVYGVVVSRNTNIIEQTEYLVGVVAPNSITGQLFGRGGNDSAPIFWVASKMSWSSDDYPNETASAGAFLSGYAGKVAKVKDVVVRDAFDWDTFGPVGLFDEY